MPQTHVTILGTTGMLGSMVLDALSQDPDFVIQATVRTPTLLKQAKKRYPRIAWQLSNAETSTVENLASLLSNSSWGINAIGIIKPYIHDDNPVETERAIRVNALFPHILAKAAEQTGTQVLQIATDCVYSGEEGQYTEDDHHDALDVYGKSKSLGEVHTPNMHHLRCSIIGPENKGYLSLLEWFLRQSKGASVKGFTNHQWNGVTTLHFAKLCQGIIKKGLELPHLQHIIPSGTIAKSDLLQSFAHAYQRADITIEPVAAAVVVDRTLATNAPDKNREIWQAAGYSKPPTVPEMVEEMAKIKLQGYV